MPSRRRRPRGNSRHSKCPEGTMRRAALSAGSLCLAIACSTGNRGPEAVSPAEPTSLHPDAVAQIEALIAEKEARSPLERKISSQLLYQREGKLPGYAGKHPDLIPLTEVDASGRVLVDLKGEMTPELLDLVAKLGGTVVTTSATQQTARAWISLEHLET